jgi:transposase
LIGSWRRIRGGRRNSSTSRRIFERLRDEYGYGSGITIVSAYVHEQRQRLREMFVPLRHDLGHAQVDFGEALAVIAGEERKIHFFAMDLPHSDACLVQAYPAETTEAFCEGHNIGFEFFGGVPRSILYDNTKLAVARILGYGRRHSARGPSTSCRIRRSLRAAGQRQRQRQGRRAGRLRAAQLARADPAGDELR